MEVENYNDYGMPRRALVYDAAEYEKEVSERKETLLKERKLGTFEERKSGKRKIDKEYAPYLQGRINNYGFALTFKPSVLKPNRLSRYI